MGSRKKAASGTVNGGERQKDMSGGKNEGKKSVERKGEMRKTGGKKKKNGDGRPGYCGIITVFVVSFCVALAAIIVYSPDVQKEIVNVINQYSQYQFSIVDTIQESQATNQNAQAESKSANQNAHTESTSANQKASSKESQPKDPSKSDSQSKKPEKEKPANEEKEKKERYPKSEITNKIDRKIRAKLDSADSLYDKSSYGEAKARYDDILSKYPFSPRALYGKARCLSKLAEIERSNHILEESISVYDILIRAADVPDQLLLSAGHEVSKLQLFRGWNTRAIKTNQLLAARFPRNVTLKNELGVSMLLAGRNSDAKTVFEEVLEVDDDDGFANVHLGFVYKVDNIDLEKAVHFLRKGLKSKSPGTAEGKFYFHLGDALFRLGRPDEAKEVYKEGAERRLLLSADQRSLYNVDRLTGRPWWTPKQTTYTHYVKVLEENWRVIRDEGLANMDKEKGVFVPEQENLLETGDWKQFTLYARGRREKKNCERAPKTCALIQQIPEARDCTRGQVKFSVMHPGVHVWPHTGPTNCRLRAHLGLVVPPGPKIRVVNDTRTWKEGKVIIFDDSFEHEVWHNGDSLRLVLIVDFWHPELTEKERRQLSTI